MFSNLPRPVASVLAAILFIALWGWIFHGAIIRWVLPLLTGG